MSLSDWVIYEELSDLDYRPVVDIVDVVRPEEENICRIKENVCRVGDADLGVKCATCNESFELCWFTDEEEWYYTA